jgi:DNA primase
VNNYTFAAEAIKERVSMHEAIALYAPTPAPQHGRIPCPIHAGEKFNLSFTDDLFHCFVCGSGGDVIHFVRHVLGLSFAGALDKLNTDFDLGIPLDRKPTLRERRDAQKRHREIMAERERQAAEKQAREEVYWALWDEWIRLDKNRTAYAPQSPDDGIHPLYAEAVQKIEHQSYLIDTMT